MTSAILRKHLRDYFSKAGTQCRQPTFRIQESWWAGSHDRPPPRLTSDPGDLSSLHELCRDGRLYDVEQWIAAGRPLQLSFDEAFSRKRVKSALEIALEDGNQALTLLLLCNGYDPAVGDHCPVDVPLRNRRWDLVDLLLEWGADPNGVDLDTLFDTYNSGLIERFWGLGVDMTAGHAMADSLAHHTSNKPLFGFAKRHGTNDPKIHAELNIAFAYHADEGNEKGVELCLWAGADPHAPAESLHDDQPLSR